MSKIHVTNGLRLYQRLDQLIVAATKRDAQSMLMEQGMTITEFRRFPTVMITSGKVDMQERDGEGNPVTVKYAPREVIELCGRGIIPEGE